jgi:5-methylcytosine-specific restriction enzyme A
VRSVPEWHGADDDAPVPPRVRLRVFARFMGACQICTRKIQPGDRWICDHVVAIVNGGANREANLHPICSWCDRSVKTPADVAEKSRVYVRARSHVGIKKKSRFPCGRDGPWRKKVNGQVVRR